MATLTERIIGTITFNKDVLKEVAESDDATSQAWMLLFISVALGAILQALAVFLNPDLLGFFSFFFQAQEGVGILVGVLIAYFVFYFILIYFWAAVLGFVGRGFGGKLSTAECIRIIGFSSVIFLIPSALLSFIGAIVLPDFASTFGLIGNIFALWAFAIFVYGYSIASELSIVMSLIAVIIAAILAGIIAFFIVFLLAIVVLVAIISALSASSTQATIWYL